MGLFGGGEGEPRQAGVGSGGKGGMDVIVEQVDIVLPGMADLTFMRER